MQRVLFIDRMRPEDAPAVARIWTEHDGTGLPERIGVVNRTLYRFHGLYVHMVEARDDLPGDLTERIFAARTDPAFVDTRDRLAYLELMAAIVLIGARGFLLDGCAQRLHRHWVLRAPIEALHPGKPKFRGRGSGHKCRSPLTRMILTSTMPPVASTLCPARWRSMGNSPARVFPIACHRSRGIGPCLNPSANLPPLPAAGRVATSAAAISGLRRPR